MTFEEYKDHITGLENNNYEKWMLVISSALNGESYHNFNEIDIVLEKISELCNQKKADIPARVIKEILLKHDLSEKNEAYFFNISAILQNYIEADVRNIIKGLFKRDVIIKILYDFDKIDIKYRFLLFSKLYKCGCLTGVFQQTELSENIFLNNIKEIYPLDWISLVVHTGLQEENKDEISNLLETANYQKSDLKRYKANWESLGFTLNDTSLAISTPLTCFSESNADIEFYSSRTL